MLKLSFQHPLGNSLQKHKVLWQKRSVMVLRLSYPQREMVLMVVVQPLKLSPGSRCPRGMQLLSSTMCLLSLRSLVRRQQGRGKRPHKEDQVPPQRRLLEKEVLPCSKETCLLQISKRCFSRTPTTRGLQQNPKHAAALGAKALWVASTRTVGFPCQKNIPWPAEERT